MIVDDNGINLMVLEKLLNRTRVKVDSAEGGREAIDMVRNKKYDLIMLDHMMPDIDGIETLHLMKKENLIGDTPVICVTANAIAGAREMYLQNGFQDYIAKPVSGTVLERMLLAWLSKDLVKDKQALIAEKMAAKQEKENENITQFSDNPKE